MPQKPQKPQILTANACSAIKALCFKTRKMAVCERGSAAPNVAAEGR